jgi:hypothetical protein
MLQPHSSHPPNLTPFLYPIESNIIPSPIARQVENFIFIVGQEKLVEGGPYCTWTFLIKNPKIVDAQVCDSPFFFFLGHFPPKQIKKSLYSL